MTIGFIGLGAMGMPMARNILKAGFPLTAYDINPAAVNTIAGEGAEAAENAAALARASDAVITILPADKQILDVYMGPDGILANAKEGALLLEMTSALGATVHTLMRAAKDMGKPFRFIDAPVSGGVAGAEAGTLTIMLGGGAADIEEARPILNAMGKNLVYAGDPGDGKNVKMVNQFLNAANTYMASEAFFLAEKLGIDTARLLDILVKSTGNSWVLENNVKKFALAKNYEGGFKLGLMKKDLDLALAQAADSGLSLPGGEAVMRAFSETSASGAETLNYNSVFEWIRRHNGD